MPDPIDIEMIEYDLRSNEGEPASEHNWLHASCQDREPFWNALKSSFDHRLSGQGISNLFQNYNFFHDFVIRNRERTEPAFSWYDRVSGDMKSLHYKELCDMASTQASGWYELGVTPGQAICIVRALGIEFVVELLASLKLGLQISLLPPEGKSYLQKRLAALQPDHIATAPRYLSLLPDWREKVLTDQIPTDYKHYSDKTYTYQTGQTVFRCFDPCSPATAEPVAISSDTVYLSAMSDGIISLGLKPGENLATAGLNLVETQPALLLAVLANGATYTSFSIRDISDNPTIVCNSQYKVFGVCKDTRQILLDTGIKVGTAWQTWFRNPAESSEMEQWQLFIKNLDLGKSYAFNLRWTPSVGGCSLISRRIEGMAHTTLLPAPGRMWTLAPAVGTSETPVLQDSGVFNCSTPGKEDEDQQTTSVLVIRHKTALVFMGQDGYLRKGRCFPISEILETLANVTKFYSLFFSIVAVPLLGEYDVLSFDLLVFSGGRMTIDRHDLESDIKMIIDNELGDKFRPDRIELFPLFPRFTNDMVVDHQWCRDQYITGNLSKKSGDKIFQCISQLRGSIQLTRLESLSTA